MKDGTNKRPILRIILIILIVLICLCLICTISLHLFIENNKNKIIDINSKAIIEDEKIIEYGSSLTYNDIISKLILTDQLFNNTIVKISINNTLIGENEEYSFNTVGNANISIETSTQIISFLNKTADFNKQINWKIQDTKLPIISGVQDREITVGDTIDIKSGITANDEIDGDLEIIIEGNFDLNTAGEYTLVAKAIDKNQNEAKQEFKLKVNEKPISESPTVDTNSSNNTTSSKTTSSKNTTSSNKSTASNATASSNKNTNTQNNKSNSNSNSANNSNKNTGSTSSADPASTKAGRLSLAKAEAKRVVGKIIKSGMNKKQKAEAICDYITTTVSVQSNQSSEAYKTNYGNEAYAALILKKAACSGRCKAVTLLCDAAGLKSQHINAGQWTHQWNKVQIDDGSWIVIDAQIGFVGTKHPLED